MSESINWNDPPWDCPRCRSVNSGWREICRICGFDTALVSEGHYFGKHTRSAWEPRDAAMNESEKIRHMAKLINGKGQVSPLCAKKPKAINLAKESWTNRRDAVTCPKCIAVAKEGEEPKP